MAKFSPAVYFSLPESFKLLPDALPLALPPPIKERSFRSPFGINKELFDFALRPEVPIIIATTYILAVFSLNAYNRERKWAPWSIARTRVFQPFVVVHNVVLAIYSILTFLAMTRAATHVWPGWKNGAGAAGIVDAFCKLHGPRVLGDATTYNTTLNIWEAKNPLIHLTYHGTPDPTDVGRLWNEGLAFWGWVFYVSKFYEVVDTLIILAKGKRSATLQTYHHAGAMLCMWAGIRYMSPPIWMFVWINSGIHALMYTYYTLSALGYRVPTALKRSLTTMQIAQFIFGASFAALHLFVKYDAPVSLPYQVESVIKKVASVASDLSGSATSAISAVAASPIATTPIGNYLKKLLLRAAGEEGVAERVHNDRGDLISPKMEEKINHFYEKTVETRYHTEWTKTSCLDTSGQAFAIYLNLLYLFPLTWLFGRFFFKAYLARGKPRSASDAARQAYLSAKDAELQTEAKLEQVEADVARRASFSKTKAKTEFRREINGATKQIERTTDWVHEKAGAGRSQNITQSIEGDATESVDTIIDSLRQNAVKAGEKVSEATEASEKSLENAFNNMASKTSQGTKDSAEGIEEETSHDAQKSKEKVSDSVNQAVSKAEDVTEQLAEKAVELQEKASKTSGNAKKQAKKQANKAQKAFEQAVVEPEGIVDDVDAAAKNAISTAKETATPSKRTPSPEKKQNSMIPVKAGKKNGSDRPESRGKDKVTTTSSKDDEKTSNGTGDEKATFDESTKTQDANLVKSRPVRPGAPESGEEKPLQANEDTDAMGRSGIDVSE